MDKALNYSELIGNSLAEFNQNSTVRFLCGNRSIGLYIYNFNLKPTCILNIIPKTITIESSWIEDMEGRLIWRVNCSSIQGVIITDKYNYRYEHTEPDCITTINIAHIKYIKKGNLWVRD